MTKLGTGLSAVVAGTLLWPMTALAADKAPTIISMSEITTSLEADILLKNFSVGFIRPASPYEALVSPITGDNQTTGNKRLLGRGDQVYLELTSPHDVAPGDSFTVYRRVKKVYHPVRSQYLGDLTAVIGVVKVLRVTGNKATVKIERSFEAMFPGDGAMRQAPPAPAPASSNQSLPDGTGIILELPPGQTLIGQGHIVYIDWGRNEGMKLGDRLEVFRETSGIPIQIIGELQIVALEDLTSTARVTRSVAPFLRGDRFASQATLQKQFGLDVPSPQARNDALFQELTEPAPTAVASAPAATGEMSQAAHAAPQSRDIERELAQLARQLEFDPGSAPATAAGLPILNKIKALLKEVPDRRVIVAGHTDNQMIGPSLKEAYSSNQELSRARAASVADYLAEDGGVDPRNISVVGHAAAKPVASNSTEAGRKRNRRIEITLLPSEQPSAPTSRDVMPEARDPSPPAQEPAPQVTAPPAP
jgi:chemotaxis protein MotB